jgi:hypothetical protein
MKPRAQPETPPSPTVDGAHFGERLLRPARPTLGAARVLAREEEDLRALWERAAAQSLIPASWLERAPLIEDDLEGAERDAPATAGHALVFASDAAAIETVQTLARSLAYALSVWGVCDADASPRWRLVERSAWRPAGLHPLLLMHARVAMPKASLFDGVRLSFLGASRDAASAREVADTLRFAALWRAAATMRDGATGRSFAAALSPPGFDPDAPESWPDPWTPLLEIVGLGYAVHVYERRRIVLVAPALAAR